MLLPAFFGPFTKQTRLCRESSSFEGIPYGIAASQEAGTVYGKVSGVWWESYTQHLREEEAVYCPRENVQSTRCQDLSRTATGYGATVMARQQNYTAVPLVSRKPQRVHAAITHLAARDRRTERILAYRDLVVHDAGREVVLATRHSADEDCDVVCLRERGQVL